MTMPAVGDLTGTILGGYQIRRFLGRGGMATVYAAYQIALQREIAIKVVHQDFTAHDPTFFARFEREALTTAKLSHPFILPVFDYGQDQGYVYLTMPLMTESLREYMQAELKANRLLALNEIARILDQIAAALDYAHHSQVVHRDLKPSNILLDSRQRQTDNHFDCRLCDFGIAHLIDSGDQVNLTGTGVLVGTPAYMSPEQWSDSAVGPASDLYALGVLLYELVSGQLPFRGQTVPVMMGLHLNASPAPINRKGLPPAAMIVILKSLAKAPAARYPSAFELAAAFSAALSASLLVNVSPPVTLEDSAIYTETAFDRLADHMSEAHTTRMPDRQSTSIVVAEKQTAIRPRVLGRVRRWRMVVVSMMIVLTFGLIVLYSVTRPTALDAQRLNNDGAVALAQLDYVTAVKDFQQALSIDPNNAAAYFNLGVADEEQSLLTDAQTNYQKALQINGQLLPAHYRLAELLLDQAQIDAGFVTADEGIRILQAGRLTLDNSSRDVMQFNLYTARGHAYLLRNTPDDLIAAEADFEQALLVKAVVPYPAPVYYYQAQLDHLQGKLDDEKAAWLNVIRYADPISARENKWIIQARSAVGAQN